MKKIAVIMDTWTTIAEDQKDGYDIFITPLMVFVNKNGKVKEYRDYLDIDRKTILAEIEDRNSKLSTSLPIIGESMKKLDELLLQYEKVLIIPIPEPLSGTFASWKNIINELSSEDQKRVVLKDYYDIGMPMYEAVKELLDQYKNDDDVMEKMLKVLEKRTDNFFGSLLATDVDLLIRSGRVNVLKGTLAKLLRKKVTIEWDRGFKNLTNSSKIKKNVTNALDYAEKKLSFVKKGIKKLYVFHVFGSDKAYFDEYFNTMTEYFKNRKVKIQKTLFMDVPNTVVSHLGPKTLGIYIEMEQ